ncbi:MAG: hypothetical protein KC535_04930 [Nanoarchaeota archaeon]|nr:hypothetical protein [Nanoarchaeota archaeon]
MGSKRIPLKTIAYSLLFGAMSIGLGALTYEHQASKKEKQQLEQTLSLERTKIIALQRQKRAQNQREEFFFQQYWKLNSQKKQVQSQNSTLEKKLKTVKKTLTLSQALREIELKNHERFESNYYKMLVEQKKEINEQKDQIDYLSNSLDKLREYFSITDATIPRMKYPYRSHSDEGRTIVPEISGKTHFILKSLLPHTHPDSLEQTIVPGVHYQKKEYHDTPSCGQEFQINIDTPNKSYLLIYFFPEEFNKPAQFFLQEKDSLSEYSFLDFNIDGNVEFYAQYQKRTPEEMQRFHKDTEGHIYQRSGEPDDEMKEHLYKEKYVETIDEVIGLLFK